MWIDELDLVNSIVLHKRSGRFSGLLPAPLDLIGREYSVDFPYIVDFLTLYSSPEPGIRLNHPVVSLDNFHGS